MDAGDVVLEQGRIRERLRAARREREEAGEERERAEAFGREQVWAELLKQSLEQEREERDRLRQMKRTTREEAMELVRRHREAPHSGPATSEAAARRAAREASNREVRILVLLLMRPGGLTDQQIQETLDMNPDTERPGRWNLSDRLGLVIDSGRRRETRAGNDAIVWVAWRHFEAQGRLELAAG